MTKQTTIVVIGSLSLLMTNSLTVVTKVFSYTLIFLLQKCEFCNAKATHIFSPKNINVSAIFKDRNFNVTFADSSITSKG